MTGCLYGGQSGFLYGVLITVCVVVYVDVYELVNVEVTSIYFLLTCLLDALVDLCCLVVRD